LKLLAVVDGLPRGLAEHGFMRVVVSEHIKITFNAAMALVCRRLRVLSYIQN
jgi:hypothetical protein